jgi:ornithine cyclodeaminase/alanine dehydrogenase-like protein (mu-crystallin family)
MITNEQVASVVGYADGAAAARRALRLLRDDAAIEGGRDRFDVGAGRLLNSMWAASLGDAGSVVTKTYVTGGQSAVRGANLTILLYDAPTGELRATLAGDHVGVLRTAGASLVMAEDLGVTEPETLTVLGTGYQATHHVLAFLERYGSIARTRVVARSEESWARMRAGLERAGLDASRMPTPVTDAEGAVGESDVVVTATGASEPVVLGDWLTEGTYLCCVGSNSAARREIDRAALERASVVVVDDAAVAAKEAGDLVRNDWPLEGTTRASDVVGGSAGPPPAGGIRIFESQGLALYDLVLSETVLERLGGAEASSG